MGKQDKNKDPNNDKNSNKNRLIQRTGHFEKLLTYQKAQVIYDLTFYFLPQVFEKRRPYLWPL